MGTTECPECGRRFDSERGLKIHYSKSHGQPTNSSEYPWEGSSNCVTLTCERCGEDYQEREYRVDRSQFCSRACQANAATNSRESIEQSEALSALQSLAAELGWPPSQSDMREQGKYSTGVYKRLFGSWAGALQRAGLDPGDWSAECPICGYETDSRRGIKTHKTKVHDDERPEPLEALRQLGEGQERPPSLDQMREEGPYSVDTYLSAYGGWREALQAAGFDQNPYDYDRIPTPALLSELERLADALGRRPKQRDVQERSDRALNCYRNRFASWSKALEAAGFDPTNHAPQIGREELLTDLQRVAEQLGHTPTVPEYREHGEYHDSTYHSRFGSWISAQRAAGLEPTRKRPGHGSRESGYVGAWDDARLSALKRDAGRCQDCGVADHTHRTRFDRGLDVHHIVRYRKFDEPEEAHRLENLVTLCRSCHADRHAKD